MRNKVQEHNFTINSRELKIWLELSPERREKVKRFFPMVEKIKNVLAENQFRLGTKELRIYNAAIAKPLGSFNQVGDWTWHEDECQSLGLRTADL